MVGSIMNYNNMEEVLILRLSRNLPGGTEEKHAKYKSVQ
jgi:hypothetical protein